MNDQYLLDFLPDFSDEIAMEYYKVLIDIFSTKKKEQNIIKLDNMLTRIYSDDNIYSGVFDKILTIAIIDLNNCKNKKDKNVYYRIVKLLTDLYDYESLFFNNDELLNWFQIHKEDINNSKKEFKYYIGNIGG